MHYRHVRGAHFRLLPSGNVGSTTTHGDDSRKSRHSWLNDPLSRRELYAYNATILKSNVDSPALLISGVEDHIHILCSLSRKFAIKDAIKKSKTETTERIKKQGSAYSKFQWQARYGIYSVSHSNVEQV